MSVRAVAKRLYSSAREVPTKRYEYIYGVSPNTKNFQKFREEQKFFTQVEMVYDRKPYDRLGNRMVYFIVGLMYVIWAPYVYGGKIMKKLKKKD